MKNVSACSLRILFYGIWFCTGIYALLAFVPFTFRQVISIGLLPWINEFAVIQHWLIFPLTGALALWLFKIEPAEKISPEDRTELIGVLAMSLLAAIWDLPLNMRNNTSALVISFVSFVPCLWLALFDLRSVRNKDSYAESSWVLGGSAILAAMITATLFGIAYGTLRVSQFLTILSATLGWAAIISLLESFIIHHRVRLKQKFRLYGIFTGSGIALFLYDRVCSAIAFYGLFAAAWSMACGLTMGFALAGLSAVSNNNTQAQENRRPALCLFISGLNPLGNSLAATLFALILLFMMTFISQSLLAHLDWNGLLQQLMAVSILFVSFALIYVFLIERFGFNWAAKRVVQSLITIAAFSILISTYRHIPRANGAESTDPLFAVASSVLFKANDNSELFRFIQRHTSLPRSVASKLPTTVLLNSTHPVNALKPNIFIFVIDSLRRDYVGPYNDKVKFTKAMQEFGNESHVFENAFTRYGATGLSEPSIWAGRMLPHQMYPQPFYAINTLQKLIEADHYRAWVSRDSILSEILKPSEIFEDLDQGVSTQDLDLCRTSREILQRLQSHPSTHEPIFTYTQSQNIHVSVLARKAHTQESDESVFDNFSHPYAQALNEVDNCFGSFIAGLKKLGIYDNSIVILTSDHGDSLGEGGRFGHAYTIFPEVMRIPLIIHLPTVMQATVTADTKRLAFSIDVAPTLSALLGHPIIRKEWIDGTPLFHMKNEPPSPEVEQDHLVASSYGPVAGLLSVDGKSLRISDAVNFLDYDIRITDTGSSTLEDNPEASTKYETLLKEKFDQLDRYYGIEL